MFPAEYNSQSSAIASYDYNDIAEGTGMKMFYAATTSDGTGILTENQIYSRNIEIGAVYGTSAVWTKKNETTFSLSQFNAPRVIEGTALVSLGMIGDNAVSGALVVNFFHYDGTTETFMASGASFRYQAGEADTIKITLPRTSFKKGDILRIKNELWYASNDSADFLYYGIDPMNRDGTHLTPSTDADNTSQLKLWVPFKLDL